MKKKKRERAYIPGKIKIIAPRAKLFQSKGLESFEFVNSERDDFIAKHHIAIKTPFQKKLWKIFVFLAKFAALSVTLHFLLWVNFDATKLQITVAKAIEKMILLTGIEITRNGTFLYMTTKTGALSVQIIKDCVGWKSVIALFGLIFATPDVSFRNRVLGLIAGAPIIFAGNILRIYATILVTVSQGLEFWEITHTYLWQEGLIILVIAVWYAWLNICKRSRN